MCHYTHLRHGLLVPARQISEYSEETGTNLAAGICPLHPPGMLFLIPLLSRAQRLPLFQAAFLIPPGPCPALRAGDLLLFIFSLHTRFFRPQVWLSRVPSNLLFRPSAFLPEYQVASPNGISLSQAGRSVSAGLCHPQNAQRPLTRCSEVTQSCPISRQETLKPQHWGTCTSTHHMQT